MPNLQDARLKLRSELEAPAALRRFGSGWISGTLGLVLGIGAFLLVLTMRAPGAFTTPELRGLATNPWFRFGLHALFILAFSFSALSLVLRREKMLGGVGIAITLLGTLLGGPDPPRLCPMPLRCFSGSIGLSSVSSLRGCFSFRSNAFSRNAKSNSSSARNGGKTFSISSSAA